jgi:hypothetical protein
LITQKTLKEIVNYDLHTGIFTTKLPRPNSVAGKIIGTKNGKGYLVASINNKLYRLHRLAWLYVYGRHPTHQIDHINGLKDDNRIGNLRDVVSRLNTENQHKAPKNSNSGFLGVSWCKQKNKYRACIVANGKQNHIGFYVDKEDAAKAYFLAKTKLHKGYVPICK